MSWRLAVRPKSKLGFRMWRTITLLILLTLTGLMAWDTLAGHRLSSALLIPALVVVAAGVASQKPWTVPSLATLTYLNIGTLLTAFATTSRQWLSAATGAQVALSLVPAAVWAVLWCAATYGAYRVIRGVHPD